MIEQLQQQAAEMEEQAAELEALNDELSASEARLRGVVDSSLDAIVTTDSESRILEWNHHAEAIFGWTAEEAVGRSLGETIIPRRFRAAHQRGVQHYLATGEGPILNQRIEIFALRRSGAEFPVELTVSASRWGTQVIFTSFIRDISERRRTEQHLAARYAVTRILAEAPSTGQALPALLEAVCRALEWEMGVFWSVDPTGGMLRPAHLWAVPEVEGGEFEAATRRTTFAPGVGLPGRVWERREPIWIPDVTRDDNFPRLAAAAREGVHGAFAFPVRVGAELLGVIECFTRRVAEPDPALLATMDALGSDLGQFVKRKAAEEELRERSLRDALGAEVGAAVTEGGSLREVLQRSAEAVARHLDAALARIWTLDDTGEALRLQASAGLHSRPREEHTRLPLAGSAIGRIAAERKPRLSNDLRREPQACGRELAEREGITAFAGYPLVVGQRAVGVVALFSREPLTRSTLEALRSVVDRIALAVERWRSAEALRESEEVQRFLARVGTKLAAATPDYAATLRKVARLAVPTLADWCAVYMADGDGLIRRLEIVHTDPSCEPLARELAGVPVRADGAHPAARAMRTGEPVLLSEVSAALMESVASTPREQELLRGLGLHSSMGVPLLARGRTLGALTFNSAHPGYRYEERDLRVAEEFARRAALSVDNARLYAEAQEANRAKTDFLATISHELRTPLNAMIGYTDLMEAGIPEPLPEAVLQYVKRVGLSAHHLLQLIEEILAFSRLEAGREEVSLEPVEVAELLGEVQAIIEPLAAAKGLRFRVRPSAEPLTVRTDPRKVRQILLNLLGNAVKFTEEGEVRFCAERDGDAVLFRVEDTGAGIEPGHLERIFEPFWQVEQGNTRTVHGTGLGLSVTRRLAGLLGGSVEVESTPGEGTRFTVRLPLAGAGERE